MAGAVVFISSNITKPWPTSFFYSLLDISRDVLSYICSRQVSNPFFLLIEFLGLISQIIVILLTYPIFVVDIVNEVLSILVGNLLIVSLFLYTIWRL